MNTRDLWTTWDWRKEPEAPRSWEHPERRVVIVEGLHTGSPSPAALTAVGPLRDAVEHGLIAVLVEPPGVLLAWYPDECPRFVPALRGERQTDLSPEALRALTSVPAPHRALVVSPREELDITAGQNERWNFPTAIVDGRPVEWADPGPKYIGVDLVICQGPTGPDAWPMHPAWVRRLKQDCDAAGVAFAMTGWGEWAPRESAPDVLRDMRMLLGGVEVVRINHEHPGRRLLDGVEHLALPEGL